MYSSRSPATGRRRNRLRQRGDPGSEWFRGCGSSCLEQLVAAAELSAVGWIEALSSPEGLFWADNGEEPGASEHLLLNVGVSRAS
jgi:hypothetical protein